MASKADVLAAVQAHFAEHDAPPSVDWLTEHLGSTGTAIRQHLKVLRAEGVVTWEPRDFTTLKLLRPTSRRASAPVAAPTYAPGGDRLLADFAAVQEIADLVKILSERVARLRGSPSLAMALAGLLGAAPVVEQPTAPPAPARPRARKAKAAPKAKRVTRRARGAEEPSEALYRTMTRPSRGVPAKELAEFSSLDAARKALGIDRRAHSIVEIATGDVVESKGRKPVVEDEDEEE